MSKSNRNKQDLYIIYYIILQKYFQKQQNFDRTSRSSKGINNPKTFQRFNSIMINIPGFVMNLTKQHLR